MKELEKELTGYSKERIFPWKIELRKPMRA